MALKAPSSVTQNLFHERFGGRSSAHRCCSLAELCGSLAITGTKILKQSFFVVKNKKRRFFFRRCPVDKLFEKQETRTCDPPHPENPLYTKKVAGSRPQDYFFVVLQKKISLCASGVGRGFTNQNGCRGAVPRVPVGRYIRTRAAWARLLLRKK